MSPRTRWNKKVTVRTSRKRALFQDNHIVRRVSKEEMPLHGVPISRPARTVRIWAGYVALALGNAHMIFNRLYGCNDIIVNGAPMFDPMVVIDEPFLHYFSVFRTRYPSPNTIPVQGLLTTKEAPCVSNIGVPSSGSPRKRHHMLGLLGIYFQAHAFEQENQVIQCLLEHCCTHRHEIPINCIEQGKGGRLRFPMMMLKIVGDTGSP